ncbi:radical SAM protein [Thermococcus stetteri]|uniref:radical SAM protein n=1 Tax=Thermococcus stetteri TaxID=49900 RepID=UPI0031587C40|nr:pyruvate-formate lyase-activating enzyme [Thermococcus stetteri]
MRVYHIVRFKSESAYVLFDGCSWNCSFCVWREVTRWSLCLPEETRRTLEALWENGKVRYLSVDEVVEKLEEAEVTRAFLGGGEPTLDPELKALMRALRREGIKPWLVTNGENLDDEMVELAEGITFSIKALDDDLHRVVTGVSNARALENFKRYAKTGKLVAETVFAPGIVECDEIERIARFIASIDPTMALRIDPLVQGVNLERVDDCIERLKGILPGTNRIRVKGKVEPPEVLYPEVEEWVKP